CDGRHAARPAQSLRLIRLRHPLLVEAALVHGMGFAHQDVGGDLVLGAAELAQRGEQNEVVEGLFRQRQTERSGFRAVFRSSHPNASLAKSRWSSFAGYNSIIMAF